MNNIGFLYIQRDLSYRQLRDMIARRNTLAVSGEQSVSQERGTLAVKSCTPTANISRGALRGRCGVNLRAGRGAVRGVSLASSVSSADFGVTGGGQRAGEVGQGLEARGRGAGLRGRINSGITCCRNRGLLRFVWLFCGLSSY